MTNPLDDSRSKDPGRFIEALREELHQLRADMRARFDRHVALGDLLLDRWETARFYGFGEGSSCYNNVLIIGEVRVGRNTWIGPNVVLDGSGGLEIGDFVSVSAGVQIYTHQTVEWSVTRGEAPARKAPTRIGSGVYIGPNTVIQMGVTVGDDAVIGAMSFVNRDVAPGTRVFGVPARIAGSTAAERG